MAGYRYLLIFVTAVCCNEMVYTKPTSTVDDTCECKSAIWPFESQSCCISCNECYHRQDGISCPLSEQDCEQCSPGFIDIGEPKCVQILDGNTSVSSDGDDQSPSDFVQFVNVSSLPKYNPNEGICRNGICRFGMVDLPDGSCNCCISCEDRYNRPKKGNIQCPENRKHCSDECLPGYENVRKYVGYFERCRKSKTTTESSKPSTTPNSTVFNETDQPNSSSSYSESSKPSTPNSTVFNGTDQSYIPETHQPNSSNSDLYWIIIIIVPCVFFLIIVRVLIKRKKKQDPGIEAGHREQITLHQSHQSINQGA